MATDIQILRDLVEDADGTTFSDDEITAFLSQANSYDPLPASVTLTQMYWAAYLGWIRKAGKIRVKKQKIAIFSKDTYVTYEAAIEQANLYKELSLTAGPALGAESAIAVQIPALDMKTGLLESSIDGTDPVPVDGLAEIW